MSSLRRCVLELSVNKSHKILLVAGNIGFIFIFERNNSTLHSPARHPAEPASSDQLSDLVKKLPSVVIGKNIDIWILYSITDPILLRIKFFINNSFLMQHFDVCDQSHLTTDEFHSFIDKNLFICVGGCGDCGCSQFC